MAHRVIHKTKYGFGNETLRVFAGPDRDTVAMYVATLFGSQVISVEPIADDAPRVWGEMDFEGNFTDPLQEEAA